MGRRGFEIPPNVEEQTGIGEESRSSSFGVRVLCKGYKQCITRILESGTIDESLNVAKILPLHVVESVDSRPVFHFQASNHQDSSF